ncbi:LysR family transcriptional regulator [Sphingobacterium psychroaquaticum]|uniref:LysR family transcriptional regulator n=1 Tax=Sphingobacterium psychroaquaticum TaxID=561061 RepID=UPI00106C7723|nr:LysR family transcriptional regulator [Sphingobacterium psychroaquaticum]QBQ41241.1 LysR family transcriptional regulator [Sphingobacterium psychroaquaticum]
MLEINFRIKVFYVVAKELSFTRAARELFISQPAVSKHIQELETSIGQALFLRKGKGLVLTEAGHTLLDSAKVIMKEYALADYRLGLLRDQVVGQLIVGASTTLAQYIMPKLIAGFVKEYPDVRIKLFNGNTADVDRWLNDKRIGIGFVEGLPEDSSLKYSKLWGDSLVPVARPDHPIFKDATIKLDDLRRQEFIFREQGSGTNDIVFQRFKQFGIEIKELLNRVQMSSSESIKRYVELSDCIGIMSIHAVKDELERKDLRLVEVEGFSIHRHLYMVHLHGEVSGLPKLFMRYVEKNKSACDNYML